MKPPILAVIDNALSAKLPKGINAIAESAQLHDLAIYLEAPITNRVLYQPEGQDEPVAITRSSTQIGPTPVAGAYAQGPGWLVRLRDGFERPEPREQPRDPETGQFLPFPEEGA